MVIAYDLIFGARYRISTWRARDCSRPGTQNGWPHCTCRLSQLWTAWQIRDLQFASDLRERLMHSQSFIQSFCTTTMSEYRNLATHTADRDGDFVHSSLGRLQLTMHRHPPVCPSLDRLAAAFFGFTGSGRIARYVFLRSQQRWWIWLAG